jgi:hypothetical protein
MISTVSDALADDIEKMPKLSEELPCDFGGSTITDIQMTCAACGRELGPDTIRGSFQQMAGGHAVNLEGYGVCYECRTITPVSGKFHDDGVVIYRAENGWKKEIWTTKKSGLIGKLKFALKEKWQMLLPPILASVIVAGWVIKTIVFG